MEDDRHALEIAAVHDERLRRGVEDRTRRARENAVALRLPVVRAGVVVLIKEGEHRVRAVRKTVERELAGRRDRGLRDRVAGRSGAGCGAFRQGERLDLDGGRERPSVQRAAEVVHAALDRAPALAGVVVFEDERAGDALRRERRARAVDALRDRVRVASGRERIEGRVALELRAGGVVPRVLDRHAAVGRGTVAPRNRNHKRADVRRPRVEVLDRDRHALVAVVHRPAEVDERPVDRFAVLRVNRLHRAAAGVGVHEVAARGVIRRRALIVVGEPSLRDITGEWPNPFGCSGTRNVSSVVNLPVEGRGR